MMKQKMPKYGSWAALLLWAGTFGFAMLTLHEMQTEEGIGLYWALKAGAERRGFDVAVDAAAAFGLLLLAGLPCLILGHRSPAALLRFLTGFLAFMPQLSMSYLVHLFDGGERIISCDRLTFVLQAVLPFGCVLLAAVSVCEKPWKKWYTVLVLGAAVFGIMGAFWETEALGAVMTYLLLLVCFDVWERLLELYPKIRGVSWILFGGLWLRAVYCMLFIKSIY